MYIMHFVEQWENHDNQVIEVHGTDAIDCMLKYLERCRMVSPQVRRIAKGLVWTGEDDLCAMIPLNEHIYYCYWTLT